MRRVRLSIPEIAIIAGTRAALGAGIGLLAAEYMSPSARRAAGWTLIAVGAITTVPILAQLVSGDDADTPDSDLAELDQPPQPSFPAGVSGPR